MADSIFGNNSPLIPSLQEAYSRDPRRLLVQSLMQQGQQTMQTPTYSPGAALAKALTIGLGGISNAVLTSDYQKQNQGALQALQDATAGASGTPQWVNPDTGEVAIPQSSGLQNMIKALSSNPATASMATQLAVTAEQNKQAARYQQALKLTEQGLTPGANGGVTVIPGYAEGKGAIAGAEAGAKAQATNLQDLIFKPAIAGATAKAENPAMVARAVAIANDTAPIEVKKQLQIATQTAPIEVAKRVAEINAQNKFEPVTIVVPQQMPDGTTKNVEVTTTRAELALDLQRRAGGAAVHQPTELPQAPAAPQAPPPGVPVPNPPPVPGLSPPGGGAAPGLPPVPQAPQVPNGAPAVTSAPAPAAPVVQPAPVPPAAAAPAAQAGSGVTPSGLPYVGAKVPQNIAVPPLASEDAKEVANDRQSAIKGQEDIATIRMIQDFLPKVSTGPLAEEKLEAARILKLMGAPDDKVREVTGTDVSSGQILQKKFLELSSAAARTLGAREPGSVIQMFAKAYPNLGTDPQAINLQTNALLMDRIRQQELATQKYNYLNNSINSYQAGSPYRGLKGFNEEFNKAHPPEYYLHAAEAMSGAGEAWKAVTSPEQQQAVIDLIPSGSAFIAPNGARKIKP